MHNHSWYHCREAGLGDFQLKRKAALESTADTAGHICQDCQYSLQIHSLPRYHTSPEHVSGRGSGGSPLGCERK